MPEQNGKARKEHNSKYTLQKLGRYKSSSISSFYKDKRLIHSQTKSIHPTSGLTKKKS